MNKLMIAMIGAAFAAAVAAQAGTPELNKVVQ
jgi:hypothetical protein